MTISKQFQRTVYLFNPSVRDSNYENTIAE